MMVIYIYSIIAYIAFRTQHQCHEVHYDFRFVTVSSSCAEQPGLLWYHIIHTYTQLTAKVGLLRPRLGEKGDAT